MPFRALRVPVLSEGAPAKWLKNKNLEDYLCATNQEVGSSTTWPQAKLDAGAKRRRSRRDEARSAEAISPGAPFFKKIENGRSHAIARSPRRPIDYRSVCLPPRASMSAGSPNRLAISRAVAPRNVIFE